MFYIISSLLTLLMFSVHRSFYLISGLTAFPNIAIVYCTVHDRMRNEFHLVRKKHKYIYRRNSDGSFCFDEQLID